MEAERRLRPVFRVAAILVGLVWLVGSLSLMFAGVYGGGRWYLALQSLVGLISGVFFLHVGITGTNYVLENEQDDHER